MLQHKSVSVSYIKNAKFSYVAAENVLRGNNIKRALHGGFDLHKIRTIKT